ncbi:MAG TPA: V-type ATP synthase subunit D [Leifsonia sp.]|jgi:vacuolar-type H+-ATPase subunit D/Vma8
MERGRAGRTRLRRRLTTAGRGAELLDRKDRILAAELDRLRLRERRSRAEWEQCAGVAAEWLIRAAALDGSARIATAAPSTAAEVVVIWGGDVGVRYPEDVVCDPPIASGAGGTSALTFAAAAHRAAVVAGVRYAGVRRSISLVSAELSMTRVRRRAIENRWIPRLQRDLKEVQQQLDELELEDTFRVRWASAARGRDIDSAP